ncbi:MAG TPA: DUF177 domain-containing protein [Sphingomicrobium sp.]|nr:DUF177 domain-containing protein [Sphingomicrobium sp.]
MTESFAHRLRLDRIHDGERLDLAADEDERRAIAARLGLAALNRLEAHVTLSRQEPIIRVEGRLIARVDQSCVVTGDPVTTHVDERLDLVFMPEPQESSPDQEVELGSHDCDVVFYDGGAIDLGGAIADTLALSLDPYPRSAGAEAALKEAGVLSEEQASPFAVLAALKKGDQP